MREYNLGFFYHWYHPASLWWWRWVVGHIVLAHKRVFFHLLLLSCHCIWSVAEIQDQPNKVQGSAAASCSNQGEWFQFKCMFISFWMREWLYLDANLSALKHWNAGPVNSACQLLHCYPTTVIPPTEQKRWDPTLVGKSNKTFFVRLSHKQHG